MFFLILTAAIERNEAQQLSTNYNTSGESRIKLIGNGYEDIVVAISPDVKPADAKQQLVLIEKIQVNHSLYISITTYTE